jgi:aminoglycoside phosphotransferase
MTGHRHKEVIQQYDANHDVGPDARVQWTVMNLALDMQDVVKSLARMNEEIAELRQEVARLRFSQLTTLTAPPVALPARRITCVR